MKFSKYITQLLLLIFLFPFICAFDLPDSSGVYLRGGAGQGRHSYRVSGCQSHTDYLLNVDDSQLELLVSKGTYFGGGGYNHLKETTRIEEYGDSEGDGRYHHTSTRSPVDRYSYLFYGGRRLGYADFCGGLFLGNYIEPVFGINLRLNNRLRLTSSYNLSMPNYTGGWPLASGMGLDLGTMDIWFGPTVNFKEQYESSFNLKIKKKFAYLDIRLSGMLSNSSVYDYDYAISLGMDVRLSPF